MVNRKRRIILRCPVTAEERTLIEQKMAQLQTKRIGAYLRKMAIDGYIIYVDTNQGHQGDEQAPVRHWPEHQPNRQTGQRRRLHLSG